MEAIIDEAKAIAQADRDPVDYGGYEEVREARTGKLLFELDAERLLIRVVERKRVRAIINLGVYGLAYVGDKAAADRGFA